ncbi:MAG: ROK family protein [Bacteroidota bacterium]|nr:sugar kinase [Odoribacter sp.]MDP3642902.1 ROK family protein [Bacteroidota bacterium]
MKLIGVDLGGTKITAALIENEKIVKQFTCPTPYDRDQIEVIDAVAGAISEVFDPEALGIGIGVPGLVDLEKNQVLDVINIPSWDIVPLKQLLEDRFPRPVFVNNDANCFALGEKHFGKGKLYRNFVGLTIGTGLGAGIIINNHLYSGQFCGAGEFGNIYYRDSNIENYCSGMFFKNQNLSGKEQAEKAQNGNADALKLFDELGCHLARGLGNILFALAPEAIILGGSVSQSFPLFEKSMRKTFEDFPYQRLYQNLKFEVSTDTNMAVLGAASLVIDAL